MPDPYKTVFVTPPVTKDLTILETVKEELVITNTDSDAVLSRYISEQSDVATSYCRRELAEATVIDTFDVSGYSQPLIPSRFPVTTIIEIIQGSSTLLSSDYEYDEKSGQIWKLNGSGVRVGWPTGRVTVTYTGGYVLLTTLPRDLERAVLILIKESWYARGRDPRARSETVEGIGRTDLWVGTIPGGGALPADATALLEPYRTIFV